MLIALVLFTILAGGNLDAQELQVSAPEQVALARELLPNLKNAAVITVISQTQAALKELIAAGNSASIKFNIYDLASVAEVREGFQMATKSKVDLIWLLNDEISNHNFGRRLILERSLSARIPVYSYTKEYLREGALFAVEKDASGGVVVYFNHKIGDMLGVQVPSNFSRSVTPFPQ